MYDKFGNWQDSDNDSANIPQGEFEYEPVTVIGVPVTGLDNKTYVEYRAVVDGYGIIAMGSREFAENARNEYMRQLKAAEIHESGRNE